MNSFVNKLIVILVVVICFSYHIELIKLGPVKQRVLSLLVVAVGEESVHHCLVVLRQCLRQQLLHHHWTPVTGECKYHWLSLSEEEASSTALLCRARASSCCTMSLVSSELRFIPSSWSR